MTAMQSDFRLFSRPLVHQTEAAECGLACLVMVARHHGRAADLIGLRHALGTSLRGSTLAELMGQAEDLGFSTRPVRLGLDAIRQLRLPAILHWDMNHFVVLYGSRRGRFHVADPATGLRKLSAREFRTHFTGVALELSTEAGLRTRSQPVRLRLSDLWDRIEGLPQTVAQVLILTLLLQFFAILTPFYLQITIDEVLAGGNLGLLEILALGFAGVAVLQTATRALRGYVIVAAGSLLNDAIARNVFAHLVRLPVGFFERRHAGDILSRFQSLRAIRDFLTHRLVEAVVDGTLGIATIAVLFLYDIRLALIVVLGMALIAGLRGAIFAWDRRLLGECLIAGARTDSQFLETLRGMPTIRLLGQEANRQRNWHNAHVDQMNAEAQRARLAVLQETVSAFIPVAVTVVVVYFAARMTMSGGFTTGMLFAFLAYQTQVLTRGAALVDHLIEFRMLGLHLERLADLVLTEKEPLRSGASPTRLDARAPHFSVKGLAYRISPRAPMLFENIDLDLVPREVVAITGPSGQGKSTLMKVMLGLLPASAGEIRLNDIRLDGAGFSDLRKRISAVLQDDRLFTGSIAENITLWDAAPDFGLIEDCARAAAVHDDILQFPMGYNSMIGDMGSALSGGEVQRILLARALYRRPAILFLDEGTAHLDIAREAEILANLRALSIGQVVITHRPTSIAAADRALCLTAEGLVPDGKNSTTP